MITTRSGGMGAQHWLLILTLTSSFGAYSSNTTSRPRETTVRRHNLVTTTLSPLGQWEADVAKANNQFCVENGIPLQDCSNVRDDVWNFEDKFYFCKDVLDLSVADCVCNSSSDDVISKRLCPYVETWTFWPETANEYCRWHEYVDNKQGGNCTCENNPLYSFPCEFLVRHTRKVIRLRSDDLLVSGISTASMIISVLGNSAVLLVSFRHRKSLSQSKMLILFLALADMIASVLNFLESVNGFWTPVLWPFDVPSCKVIHVGMIACSWISVGFILIISMERFFGILYSMKRHLRGPLMFYGSITANLVLAIAIGVPMMIHTDVDEFSICHFHAKDAIRVPYQWFLIVFYMIIPVCVVSFFYFRIIHFLIMQVRDNVALSREDIKQKRIKDNQRTIKVLMPILAAFIACVLPMNTIELYFSYHVETMSEGGYRAAMLIQNITFPLHACVNPIIYTVIDRRFRSDLVCCLKSLLFCRTKHTHAHGNAQSQSSVSSQATNLSTQMSRT